MKPWFQIRRPLVTLGVLVGALWGGCRWFECRATAAEPPSDATIDIAALDARITAAERDHWSFLPVRRPEIPAVQDAAWVRNEIDAFVLARLEAQGWRPAPAAEPRQLLRRVYLDLIGLPPNLAEQEAFLANPSPDALDQVVNKLLRRAQYGERWARHWLDLVRYADSNGYERDAPKPHVWRYRDWVIHALLTDMPYDRFILEQLAGDELPGAEPSARIATGFYRLGPWDDEPADPAEDRYDQLDDMINTVGQTFLGLTIACARCHEHKFEPLTQPDYYRMAAIFNGLTRPQNGRTELDELVGTPEQIAAVAARDEQIRAIEKQIHAADDAQMTQFLALNPAELAKEVVVAFQTHREQRSPAQNELVRQHEPALAKAFEAWLSAEYREDRAERQGAIAGLRAATPDLPRGYFMVERGPQPPAMSLLIRGKANRPGPQVEPGLPVVLVPRQPQFLPPTEQSSGRRLTLARWIASGDNPLTARVMVNRVWQHHFGQGLVRTPSDFGVMGQEPTHPELLDWLADWFVHEGGWSLKKLHRLILSSNTYHMSKDGAGDYAAVDPENRWLWRFPYQRLSVEALRDSVLAVSGQLNPKLYGPPMYPQVPREALEGHSDPNSIWPAYDPREGNRRTIYAFVKRSLVVPLLETLDFCDTARPTAQRNVTSVAPQALSLFNGEFMQEQSAAFARRLEAEAGPDAAAQIDHALRLALCRPAAAAEQQAMQQFLATETARLQDEAAQAGSPLDEAIARRRALVQLCRVIFNLNEFAYPD